MAYYTGIANNLNDLLTALRNSAVSDGWTLSGNVLSLGTIHVEHTLTTHNLQMRGGINAAMASPSPYVSIGRLVNSATYALTYPCTWRFFGFPDEVWFSVQYDVSRYQWLAWGKSNVPGLPGTGTFVWGTVGVPPTTGSISTPVIHPLFSTGDRLYSTSGQLGDGYTAPTCSVPYTLEVVIESGNCGAGGYVHHDLDGYGWKLGRSTSNSYSTLGWYHYGGLPGLMPSAWSSESVLLPIRALFDRGSNRASLIIEHTRCRFVRLDSLEPGDILQFGSEKWMVLPWHKKNSAQRNGSSSGDHSGTFGAAVRYEGP